MMHYCIEFKVFFHQMTRANHIRHIRIFQYLTSVFCLRGATGGLVWNFILWVVGELCRTLLAILREEERGDTFYCFQIPKLKLENSWPLMRNKGNPNLYSWFLSFSGWRESKGKLKPLRVIRRGHITILGFPDFWGKNHIGKNIHNDTWWLKEFFNMSKNSLRIYLLPCQGKHWLITSSFVSYSWCFIYFIKKTF